MPTMTGMNATGSGRIEPGAYECNQLFWKTFYNFVKILREKIEEAENYIGLIKRTELWRSCSAEKLFLTNARISFSRFLFFSGRLESFSELILCHPLTGDWLHALERKISDQFFCRFRNLNWRNLFKNFSQLGNEPVNRLEQQKRIDFKRIKEIATETTSLLLRFFEELWGVAGARTSKGRFRRIGSD